MPRQRVASGKPGAPDARIVAHEVLVRVETTEAYADVLLSARLADGGLAPRDQALVTRLVYGTLAWQGRLDHHLRALLSGSLEACEPPVRAALRLGLYQLLFLDRVPAYAAVDSSVRLVERRAAGLVNAVLRRAAAAGRAGLALPADPHDPLGRLAVEWSHPRWLVERWAAVFDPAELPRLLAADNVRGPTALRANRLSTTRDALLAELDAAGAVVSPSRWATDGIVVSRRAAQLRNLPAWRDGRFAFQGEASQLVAPLLTPAAGACVLDACAGPGGKATHAAALVGEGGVVVALDPHPGGLGRLRTEAARLGAAAVRAVAGDVRRPPLASAFDAVLVDAPCSGLGTLRRHPEVRWRSRPEDVARLAALQATLLDGAAPLVRPGGVLVYAVCTLTREENEDTVARFCAAHPAFAVDPVPAPAALVTPAGFLRTLPHDHGMDGFFAARLLRRA